MLTYSSYFIKDILPKEKVLIINTVQEKVSSCEQNKLLEDIYSILEKHKKDKITCVCFWEIYHDLFYTEVNQHDLEKVLLLCKKEGYKTFYYSCYHTKNEYEIKHFESIAKNLDYIRIGNYCDRGKTYKIVNMKNHTYLENINHQFRKVNKKIL